MNKTMAQIARMAAASKQGSPMFSGIEAHESDNSLVLFSHNESEMQLAKNFRLLYILKTNFQMIQARPNNWILILPLQ